MTSTRHRHSRTLCAATAPEAAVPEAAAPETQADPPRPRPNAALPADGPWSSPLRVPRFTPRRAPATNAVPPPPPSAATFPARPAPRQPRPPAGRSDPPVRAVIGDEIRIPIMWCQFGSCVARYTHRGALGERDLRHRALAAGWRYDALGRLACPDCAQHDPTFWATRAPKPVTGHRIRAG